MSLTQFSKVNASLNANAQARTQIQIPQTSKFWGSGPSELQIQIQCQLAHYIHFEECWKPGIVSLFGLVGMGAQNAGSWRESQAVMQLRVNCTYSTDGDSVNAFCTWRNRRPHFKAGSTFTIKVSDHWGTRTTCKQVQAYPDYPDCNTKHNTIQDIECKKKLRPSSIYRATCFWMAGPCLVHVQADARFEFPKKAHFITLFLTEITGQLASPIDQSLQSCFDH